MKYINPYEIASSIHFNNLDTTMFKKFKRRLSAELELGDDEIIINRVKLHQNEIYELIDSIERDKNLLNIFKSLYENKELNNFLNGKSNENLKRLKNILSLEDKQTIDFITDYLIQILSKIYKEAFDSKYQVDILQIKPPLDEKYYEKIYEPIYKILKNKENELISLKNNYYDFNKIKNITNDVQNINALPDYFIKIRSDIAQVIRNLSIDSWNDNNDLDLAINLINYALKFNTNSKTKDKFLSDKDDLENIKHKLISEKIADQINSLQDEYFHKNIISQVQIIIKNIFNDDIVGIAIRDLSIFSWNKKEDIEIALKLNDIALRITKNQEVLNILNKDKKDLEKIKKDNTCWYCKKNIAIDDKYYAALDIWKYEETGVLGSIVGAIAGRRYFTNTIPVPRCKKCYDEHNDYGFFDFGLKKKARQKTESYLYEIPELAGWNIGSSPN